MRFFTLKHATVQKLKSSYRFMDLSHGEETFYLSNGFDEVADKKKDHRYGRNFKSKAKLLTNAKVIRQ